MLVITATMTALDAVISETMMASDSPTHRLVVTEAEHPLRASGWAPGSGFSTGGERDIARFAEVAGGA
jgi:hypothetical protein